MAEVSGVSAIPDPTSVQETTQTETSASGTVPTTIPANATVGQLQSTYGPLFHAITWAIAQNVCNYSNQSNQRIHDILADADADR